MDEFYRREEEFELVDAEFEELDSTEIGVGMLCTNSTDEAFIKYWGQATFAMLTPKLGKRGTFPFLSSDASVHSEKSDKISCRRNANSSGRRVAKLISQELFDTRYRKNGVESIWSWTEPTSGVHAAPPVSIANVGTIPKYLDTQDIAVPFLATVLPTVLAWCSSACLEDVSTSLSPTSQLSRMVKHGKNSPSASVRTQHKKDSRSVLVVESDGEDASPDASASDLPSRGKAPSSASAKK
eukprot:2776007-Amphidinium_carterae.1